MSQTRENTEQPQGPLTTVFRNPPAWLDFWLDKFLIAFLLLSIYTWNKYVSPRLQDLGSHVRDQSQLNQDMSELLTRISVKTGADRVVLGQFHNGNYWASGQPWMQLSITHEVVDEGISKIENQVQAIHVEKLQTEIELLLENEFVTIDKNQTELAGGCRRHMESIGVNRIFMAMVRGEGNQPVGIVSIQFIKANTEPTNFDELDREELGNLVSLIGYYLIRGKISKQQNALQKTLNIFQSRT